ncbi:MAG: hypothetical protein KDA96_24525 [Planctomycetaceae bacterium]|nr:hypothetical protein [Planctomycetaceae bacterium]
MRCLVTLAVLVSACGISLAAEGTLSSRTIDSRLRATSTTSVSVADFESAMYDYDVYVADPATATGWYVRFRYDDGIVKYSSAFTSYDNAWDWLFFCQIHGVDPRSSLSDPNLAWPDIDIVEMPREPNWLWVSTHDTKADAQQWVDFYRSGGLMSKMVARSVIQYQSISR